MSCDDTKAFCVPAPPTAERPETVRLRRATDADAEALALIGAATFLEAFTWMLPGADIVAHCALHHGAESYRKYLAAATTRIWMAVSGIDVPVGYAMLSAPDLPALELSDSDLELKRIYVFSRFRGEATPVVDAAGERIAGKRTAQALLDAVVEDARAMGARRLLLGVNDGNAPALGFYRRNGFAEWGTRSFRVGTLQCCDLILAKPL